ncbi:MAG TPA: extracellular solute-binding protein [Blastococcus sp.]|nr:extracellular solute-binding protein [Blastococcus sp.]
MTQLGHRRFRRLGSVVAVSAMGALTLAACGGGDDDSGSGGSGDAVDSFTFTFGNASGATDSPFQQLADAYSEETGIEIETKALPPDNYGLTLRTQLQGGNAPDVMVVSPGGGQDAAVLPLAEAGFVEPLDQTSEDLIPEGSEGLFTIDDKVYAQPTDITPVGMTWNVGAAEEAGVDAPTDQSSLLEACKASADAGKSFIVLAGAVPPNPGLMAMSISATRVYADEPDWNAQRADGDVTFADSEGWQDTLQTIVDMNEAGCFQEGFAGAGFDAITQGIGGGTSLATFVPGGAATEIMAHVPNLELQVQSFPPADGGTPYLLASPNYALAINAKADDATKKAAQDFLDWAADPENSAEYTKVSGGVSISGPGEDLSPVYEPVRDLLESGDFAPLPNLEWPNPSVYDSLATGIQGLLTGQGDIQSVLESVDKAWDNG